MTPLNLIRCLIVLALLGLLGVVYAYGDGYPMAPGEVFGVPNPAVTQGNILSTICSPAWVKNARPSTSYTNRIKLALIAALPASADHTVSAYELDHHDAIEDAGSPTDPANLWLQPWEGPWNAHLKDHVENAVHRDICTGRLSLAQGQAVFLGSGWRAECVSRGYCAVDGTPLMP